MEAKTQLLLERFVQEIYCKEHIELRVWHHLFFCVKKSLWLQPSCLKLVLRCSHTVNQSQKSWCPSKKIV